MRRSLKIVTGLWLILRVLVVPVLAAAPPDSAQAYTKPPVKFVFNFDARYTIFRNDPLRLSGVKAGLELNRRFRAGIALYGLRMPVVTSFAAAPHQPVTTTEMKFRYAAVYGEWVVLKNKRWEVSLPLQLGFGNVRTKFLDGENVLLQTRQTPFWLAEPSVAGHYKVFSWVGIGAGAGYRQTLNPWATAARELNAPVYSLKAKVFLGDLYRLFRFHFKNGCPGSENQPEARP